MDSVQSAGKQGWVLITEGIGANPDDTSGRDYTVYSKRGFGVIVRLNNGYSGTGTIPKPDQYDAFARRCANWAGHSPGANIWIIGNEMNHAGERPGGEADANKITPQMYADCYRFCRAKIKAVPGHADDLVVVGAVAPYNIQTTYPGNESGDWIQYFKDTLKAIGPECDAIALHAYTMGPDSALVASEETFPDGRFLTLHKHIRTYRDFMAAIPDNLQGVPVFITESQSTPDSGGWTNASPDWIRRVYDEINLWNTNPANQPIQCLLLFRWHDSNNAWRIDDKPGVLDDFFGALQNNYPVRLAGPRPKTYRATIVSANTPTTLLPGQQVTFAVTLQNDGDFVWRAANQPNPVRFGYRWFDPAGKSVPARADERTSLPRDVSPGERLTFPNATLIAPSTPGRYTAHLDLVDEGIDWFSDRGSPIHNYAITVVRGEYAQTWLKAPIPTTFNSDQAISVPFTFRNDGSKTWLANATQRVRLTYRWYDLKGQQVLVRQDIRASLPHDIQTGEVVSNLPIDVLAPDHPGTFVLRFDLVEEGLTYFQDRGSPPLDTNVVVQGTQDYQVTFGPAQPPVTLAGARVESSLTLRNDGRKTWNVEDPGRVRLGYHWFDQNNQPVAVAQDLRTPLPHTVAAGEQVTLTAATVAPKDPGKYRLQWSLVVEGVAWFYELNARTLDLPVEVTAPEHA